MSHHLLSSFTPLHSPNSRMGQLSFPLFPSDSTVISVIPSQAIIVEQPTSMPQTRLLISSLIPVPHFLLNSLQLQNINQMPYSCSARNVGLSLVWRHSMETCPPAHLTHADHRSPIHTVLCYPAFSSIRGSVKRLINLQTCVSLGSWRKPGHSKETNAVTGRTCKLHGVNSQVQNQTQFSGDVRQQL